MKRHFRWSSRLEEALTYLGASPDKILDTKNYVEKVCGRNTSSARLQLRASAQHHLTRLGVSPDDTYAIQTHLVSLSDDLFGEDEAKKEQAKKADAERQQKWRDAHRPEYNARQAKLMKERYHTQKAELEHSRQNLVPFPALDYTGTD